MDFWTRLVGSGGLTSRGSRQNAAGERLTRFKHICNALYHIWRTCSSFPTESPTVAHIRTCLVRLNATLNDEARAPAPHPCHAFAASSQLYLTVTKLALASNDQDIISAAALLFNTLIEAEVEGIIDSRPFARAVVDLVRRAGFAGEEGEGRLVELIFSVANNIRLRPDILRAWFAPKEPEGGTSEAGDAGSKEFAGATRKDDFPLFYLLVDYVHREGRTGDFARTGVLYIIETASRSRDLERWLIESDLATLMATGLGAQYSQLSRSSYFAVADEVPYIIQLSDHPNLPTVMRPDSEEHMNDFLTYLLFWQDAIDYCKSVEVNDTLLDHFQVLFLEQLLYPSLLESSDVDGGSTSAVTMYLSQILESIDQPGLIHRILHFLLASPSDKETHEKIRKLDKKSPMYLSRRKSLDLLASFAEAAPKPSPTLFNLVDLILMSLRSKNVHTVSATLRLISVIIQRHQHFAGSLFKTLPSSQTSTPTRPIGAFNAELHHLMDMATTVLDDSSLDQSYESYLANAYLVVQPRVDQGDGISGSVIAVQPDDGVLTGIISVFSQFFMNTVMTNLALTNAVTALASSGVISLDGWLFVPPSEYEYSSHATSKDADEVAPSEKTPTATYDQPEWPPKVVPSFSAVLQDLVRQIRLWRQEIPDFDILLAARRKLLTQEGDMPAADNVAGRSTPQLGNGQADASNGPSSPAGGRGAGPIEHVGRSPKRSSVKDSTSLKAVDPSMSRAQSCARSRVVEQLARRIVVGSRTASSADTPTSPPTVPGLNTPGSSPPSPEGEDTMLAGKSGSDPAETDVGDSNHGENPATDEGATLGHVLTNTVILYEFILELTALVQVRASVLDEVAYGQ